jgi:hypothetical protein
MDQPPFLPVNCREMNSLPLPLFVLQVDENLHGRSIGRIFPSPTVAVNPAFNAVAAVGNWNWVGRIEQNRWTGIGVTTALVNQLAHRSVPHILLSAGSENRLSVARNFHSPATQVSESHCWWSRFFPARPLHLVRSLSQRFIWVKFRHHLRHPHHPTEKDERQNQPHHPHLCSWSSSEPVKQFARHDNVLPSKANDFALKPSAGAT